MKNSAVVVMRFMLAACLLLSLTSPLKAQTENTVYTFTGLLDGGYPVGGVISGSNGHLYGVGAYGGKGTELCVPNCGVLFELAPRPNGTWSEKIHHYFDSTSTDGFTPTAGLVSDAHGNIYGTTSGGGTFGNGTIFELTAAGSYKVLYNFKGGTGDGRAPSSALVLDSQGNLYGTTSTGGSTYGSDCNQLLGCGTVFELQMSTHKEMVLHNFSNAETDGYYPGGLLFANGNLYGVTSAGGLENAGTAFELVRKTNSTWNYGVVYNFGSSSTNAISPSSALTLSGGNFYGTSAAGGTDGNGGTIFELLPNASGVWTDQLVLSFYAAIGRNPYSGVVFDSLGNLYAAAVFNGSGYGTVVEAPFDGIEQTLWNFEGGSNGCSPNSPLIFTSAGHLYGTTDCGGDGFGVVYEVTP